MPTQPLNYAEPPQHQPRLEAPPQCHSLMVSLLVRVIESPIEIQIVKRQGESYGFFTQMRERERERERESVCVLNIFNLLFLGLS